jgi:alpha-ketoglutarate-dependent taurine dioxygenase
MYTTRLVGLEHSRSDQILSDVLARAIAEIYAHRWSRGDLLLGNNRTLIHSAPELPEGVARKLLRISVDDGLPLSRSEAP